VKALHSVGSAVPLSRVLREHRAALVPLAIVLAVNLAVLLIVVLPLSRRVTTNEERANAAERARITAESEFKAAEDLRAGKVRATTDLDTFYRQVLPAGVSPARRIIELQLQQLAREHGVRFQRLGATEEELRESSLSRLTYSMTFSGDWDDIRGFIYELETSPNFVIIDNVLLAEGLDASSLTLSLELSTYYRSATRAVSQGTDGR
jgi:Tfp pilus assembly protein PilO